VQSDGLTLVRLGVVIKPHGLKGEIKIKADNRELSCLQSLKRVFLTCGGNTNEYCLASSSKLGRGFFKLRLLEVCDFASALALKGAIVSAAASDLPILPPNEFYYFQAEGCEVRTVGGLSLGYIVTTFFNGAHDVWVVKNETSELLLPVIEEIVKSIDLERRQVTVEPIPGLLDQ